MEPSCFTTPAAAGFAGAVAWAESTVDAMASNNANARPRTTLFFMRGLQPELSGREKTATLLYPTPEPFNVAFCFIPYNLWFVQPDRRNYCYSENERPAVLILNDVTLQGLLHAARHCALLCCALGVAFCMGAVPLRAAQPQAAVQPPAQKGTTSTGARRHVSRDGANARGVRWTEGFIGGTGGTSRTG